jgi:hypothetical protein
MSPRLLRCTGPADPNPRQVRNQPSWPLFERLSGEPEGHDEEGASR